ncbi:class I SAM-dependent methyltransferase [Mycolicibacterium pyrenivorans]|uniref:class I SAM-dependent methyltransferase n=1 Tax=Mycolicibacterium pyrenivorans TaxID=187102 RepID=UPI0021F2CCAC|nr:class I SAM-dependent methyltransferase [Mycolicibacterium pyrenivorans]MCV7153931.1 class I SAM-dependent methyltransferase [Mycolicibacterium pyrenivorans]
MSRTTVLNMIPPPSEREGGLGTTAYSEWCYTVGFLQSLIFQTLPEERPLRMLDIGCGVGRLYLATRPYLQPDDTYTGIDVGKSFIEICRARYTDPNVTFVHLDASNPYYASHYSDKKLPWPFEDDGFNFMTALSVWTHLNEGDFTFYLKELGRTLAPRGRALVSFFIMDEIYEETLPGRTSAQSAYYPEPASRWVFDQSAYGSRNYFHPKWAKVPEHAIGVTKAAFDETVADAGLQVAHYFPGCWKEKPGLFFQDFVVFERA